MFIIIEVHYQKLPPNITSQLEKTFSCVLHCSGVCEQNSVHEDDWTMEWEIIASNGEGAVYNIRESLLTAFVCILKKLPALSHSIDPLVNLLSSREISRDLLSAREISRDLLSPLWDLAWPSLSSWDLARPSLSSWDLTWPSLSSWDLAWARREAQATAKHSRRIKHFILVM